jgi:hypothetical protein
MRRSVFGCLSGIAAFLLLSSGAFAGGRNPADFPLRVHIFQHNSHSHYFHQSLDAVDGEGRANLYENGEPRGFDYAYHCGVRLMNSPGYETYMARWKKRDKTLEILLPEMGKPGAVDACELKVDMKNAVYHRRNGVVDVEPAEVFKQWMVRHQYDPEHGKNEPVRNAPTPKEADENEGQ